jgi:tetratricopeptide (TPR) repeat protein
MSETKSSNDPRTVQAKGIDESWAGNFDASVKELTEKFMEQLKLERKKDQSCDPNDSPAVAVLRIAFHLVLKAALTGDGADLEPALEGLNNAQEFIDQQRTDYLNVVENVAESIPVVGGLMSFLWSPVQNVTNSALDATGLRRNGARYNEQMVHAALGADAMSSLFRTIILGFKGEVTECLKSAHSSYRVLLSIPEDTACSYAKDVRNFGVGFYAILLSYLPPLYRVGFNTAAASVGLNKNDGMNLLREAAQHTNKHTIAPMLATFALLGATYAQINRDGTMEVKKRAAEHMISERAFLEQWIADPSIPDNIIIQWILVGLDSRKRNFNGSSKHLINMMTAIGPHIEKKNFTLKRSPSFSLNNPSTNTTYVHRIRVNLSIVFVLMGEWEKTIAVLEPCILHDTRYGGRGLALVLTAGALAQLNPTDTLIDEIYETIANFDDIDPDLKSGAGKMDKSLKKKLLMIDMKRVDRKIALYDLLLIMGFYGANMDPDSNKCNKKWINSIHANVQDIYNNSKKKFDKNKDDFNAKEEFAACLLLLGATICEKDGNYEDTTAENHFLTCIQICSEGNAFEKYYHIPYALLQLGNIYMCRKDFNQAKEYYERAQSFKKGYTFDIAIEHRLQGPLDSCKAEMAAK